MYEPTIVGRYFNAIMSLKWYVATSFLHFVNECFSKVSRLPMTALYASEIHRKEVDTEIRLYVLVLFLVGSFSSATLF